MVIHVTAEDQSGPRVVGLCHRPDLIYVFAVAAGAVLKVGMSENPGGFRYRRPLSSRLRAS
eukprot:scaffold146056_cov39-Prasinocladus_malaysianus.AAC.1